MDQSSDVSTLIGILVNGNKLYGPLSNIRHKGLSDNEIKIAYIINSIKSFLIEKKYMEDDELKPEYKDELIMISTMFAVNSEFSKPLKIEEYAHLTYNVPTISKYLLGRIIVSLDLTPYFCSAAAKLPLTYSSELIVEFVPCLEKVSFKKLVEDTYIILHTIAGIIVENMDLKHSDDMDTLERCVPEFFFRYSRVSVDQLTKLKKTSIFEQAGYALNNLLKLLVFCHEKNLVYGLFFDRLIDATTDVVRSVTLDMFLHWAEIDMESGETLQSEIAHRAYLINEKYKDFPSASSVVQSLSTFASKPPDLREQIRSADINKKIFMVEKADQHQKKWFQALIFSNSQIDDTAFECISKWSHLCEEDDISRLLNISVDMKNEELTKLTLKCASLLNVQKLAVVVTRHFYKNGFRILNKDTHSEMVMLFNSFEKSISDSEMVKLLLLIIQNPEECFVFIFVECLKNAFFLLVLKNFFSVLLNILKIHDIGLISLLNAMKVSPPSPENFENYSQLLQFLNDIKFLSEADLVSKVINPRVDEFMKNNDSEAVRQVLKIFNALKISVLVNGSVKGFLENLFQIMSSFRTDFMNYSSSSLGTVREVVIIITTRKVYADDGDDQTVTSLSLPDDRFVSYYRSFMVCRDQNPILFEAICKTSDFENHTKALRPLLQLMPSCVTEEWISICSYIKQHSSFKTLLNILSEMIILLCEFTENQENKENHEKHPTLLEALKYCIQQMGISIQSCILSTNDCIEIEIAVTEALVDVLCYLPQPIKESEGLNIATMMSERSLKQLGENKKFVDSIYKIKNKQLCQVIAQKILS